MPRPSGKQSDIWTQVAFYSGLGFILPAGAVAGYVLGWLLDDWLHTEPVLAIVMGFLGAAGGIVEVLRILTREEKRASRDNSNSKSGGTGSGPG
jgi:F0F1-type ATP synthase assembly protein I